MQFTVSSIYTCSLDALPLLSYIIIRMCQDLVTQDIVVGAFLSL